MDGVWGELGASTGGRVANTPLNGLSLDTDFSSGYNGQPLGFVTETVFAFQVGNGIQFVDADSGKSSTFWHSGVAIQAYAVNKARSIYAYANSQNHPIVFVHSYPSHNLLATLKDGTELDYVALAFSRDGSRLASLGSVPDFTLTLWDWEEEAALLSASIKDHVNGPTGTNLSFYAMGTDRLCLTGDGPAVVFCVDENYQNLSLRTVPSKIPEEITGDEIIPNVHAWTPEGEVYLGCHTGELFLISGETGELIVPNSIAIKTSASEGDDADAVAITGVSVTRHHVVTIDSDSFVRWYSRHDHLLCWTHQLPAKEACQLVAEPSFINFIAGTATGALYFINVTQPVPTTMVDVDAEEYRGLIELDQFFDSSYAQISSILAIPGTNCIVTASHDGTLRVWNIDEKRPVHKLELTKAITSMAITVRGDLLAVGSVTGTVRLYRIQKDAPEGPCRPDLVFRTRVHDKAVTSLSWNRTGGFLLSGSHDSTLYFFQRSDDINMEPIRVVSYVQLRSPVACSAWSLDRDDQFFVCLHNNDVLRMLLPAVDEASITSGKYEVPIKDFKRCLMKISFPATAMAMVPGGSVLDKYYQFYILATDKKVKLYTMLEDTGDPDLVDDDTVTPPDAELEGHDKSGAALAVSRNVQFLATGTSDGTLCIRNTSALEQSFFARYMDNQANGVTALTFACEDTKIAIGGGDGTVTVMNCNNRAAKPQPGDIDLGLGPFELIGEAYPDLDDDDDEEVFLVAREREIVAQDEALHAAARDQMREHVDNLKTKFRDLLKKNETVPELERLTRDDFVIDFAARDKLIAEGDKAVLKAREDLHKKNVALELIAHRIKNECWDTMKVKGVTVHPFAEGKPTVSNYAVRHVSEKEIKNTENIKAIRRAELHAAKLASHAEAVAEHRAQRAAQQPLAHEASTVSALAGDNPQSNLDGEAGAGGAGNADDPNGDVGVNRDPSDPDLGGSGGGVEGNTASGGDGNAAQQTQHAQSTVVLDDDDDDDIDAYDLDLLYDPLELTTRQRKNTQIVLLQDKIREEKEAFNHTFEKFLDSKSQDLEKIQQKSARIDQIVKELKVPRPTFVTELNSDEVPSRVLEVRDEEVTVERVLSQAERERLEEEERKRAEALAGQKRDDSAERALRQMMGGKLQESKDDRALEEDLVKPEWMETTAAEDLTDDQKKAIKEFEEEVERRALEKEKHRKALETELKKLKTQIEEIQAAFDTRLAQQLELRNEHDTRIYHHELNIIHLSRSLLREENDKLKEERLLSELETLKKEKGRTASTLTEFKREVDQYREGVENLVMQDKVMEKTFRKDFADADEFLDPLFRLFRRRHKQRGGDQRRVVTPDSDDPFAKADALAAEKNATGVQAYLAQNALDYDNDAPEGLPEYLWERLLEARQKKLESEAEIRRRNTVLQEIVRYQTMLTEEDEGARTKIDHLLSRLSAFRDERMKLAANLEKLFHLKQGQVEVEQEAVVTDYGDAVLINRNVVQQLNDRIKELGREKVVYLQQIKDIRKTIHELDWENTKLDMEAEDLLQKTRDFQLLRVTKALQELIKGGGSNRHAAEIAMLEKKSDHSKKVHEDKVMEKKRTLAKLKKLIREKETDNHKLEEHIEHLEVSVSERRNIYELQTHTTGGETEEDKSFNRFRDIVKQRKLMDLAKAQTEEIEFLQEELERLRQATFPSFAVALSQDRNPDQRIR